MATVKEITESFNTKSIAERTEQAPSGTAEASSKGRPNTDESHDPDVNVHTLQAALAQFDVAAVDEAISKLDLHSLYLDKAKYRTPIHELVLCYASYKVLERPEDLHLKCIDIVGHLINAGVDVNDTDATNQTALHLAANAADTSPIIKVLLASGSMVNMADNGQQCPLHKAALVGCNDGVVALLERGANPNLPDFMGHCPLHLAVKREGHCK